MSKSRFIVQNDTENSRYVLIDTDPAQQVPQQSATATTVAAVRIGLIDYVDVAAEDPAERVLFHTEVSPDYAGQGLASILVRASIDDLVSHGFKVAPVCPYVKGWLPKHPEYQEHAVEPTPAHIQAIKDSKQE